LRTDSVAHAAGRPSCRVFGLVHAWDCSPSCMHQRCTWTNGRSSEPVAPPMSAFSARFRRPHRQLRVVRAVSLNAKADAERDQPGQGVSQYPSGVAFKSGCVIAADDVLVRQIYKLAFTATSRPGHAWDLRTIEKPVRLCILGIDTCASEMEPASIGKSKDRRSAAAPHCKHERRQWPRDFGHAKDYGRQRG